MANKKYNEFPSGTYDTSKIFLQADPSTGELEKVNLPTPGSPSPFSSLIFDCSQVSTFAPLCVVLLNEIGTGVTTSYLGVGLYRISIDGFTPGDWSGYAVTEGIAGTPSGIVKWQFDIGNSRFNVESVNNSGIDTNGIISNRCVHLMLFP